MTESTAVITDNNDIREGTAAMNSDYKQQKYMEESGIEDACLNSKEFSEKYSLKSNRNISASIKQELGYNRHPEVHVEEKKKEQVISLLSNDPELRTYHSESLAFDKVCNTIAPPGKA